MAIMAKVKRRSVRGPRRAAWRRPASRAGRKATPRVEPTVGERREGLGLTDNEQLELREGLYIDDEL